MRKNQLHNQPHLTETRRLLRNNVTPAEAALWRSLKGSQLGGWKFRRQHSVGNYVLDFYCPEAKLAVELDGAGHFSRPGRAADVERDAYLTALGIRVLRFENELIFKQLEGVLTTITDACSTRLWKPEERSAIPHF
jgi:very-short-patch-repair endonuclease